MKVLRAIIIDDEQKGLDALKILIERFVPDVWIVAETKKPFEAIKLIESYRPEIIFLDINMPGMNGFELIENLAWKKFNLVFITAYQEHALKALKVNAFDFLLKPVDQEELKLTVKRISDKIKYGVSIESGDNLIDFKEYIDNLQKRRVIISSKSGVEPIDVAGITFLESKSNYTKIYLDDGRTIITSKCLKDYEAELCYTNFNFMRVHHSFIVNLHKVKKFFKGTCEIVMESGQKIPLANSKKEKFITWLNL